MSDRVSRDDETVTASATDPEARVPGSTVIGQPDALGATCTDGDAPPAAAGRAIEAGETAAGPSDLGATAFGSDAGSAPAKRTVPAIPGYEILGELGRGAMGVVYHARHARLNRPCALKMILTGAHADAVASIRFLAEAEAVARLRHPNIVQIHHIGEADGLPFLELEYLDGGSLDRRLDGTPWPARRAAALVEALAHGVAEAHRLGLVHRDLKPGNVLLSADEVPKITDFGLAKALAADSGPTATGSILGTPGYMAPEQAQGQARQVGPAADVYALGAILYELLTGRPPFRGATVIDTLEQVRTAEPVPPSRLVPGLPRDLETIALECLQKEPSKRYASGDALGEDLRRFRAGEPILARRTGPVERAWRWARRNPVVASLAAAVALLLLAVAAGASLAAFRFRDMARTAEYNRYLSEVALAHREILADRPGRAERLLDGCPPYLRGWEWNFLRRLSHTAVLTIPAHDDFVFCVAYSPDGKSLATASQDGTVRIWDAASGRLIQILPGHVPDICWWVAYSPDGTMLATAGRDKAVRVWNATTGDLICRLLGHPDTVSGVAYSPDGRFLASTSIEVVKLWDAKNRREIRSLPGGWSIAFSPDGRRLGSSGGPHLRIWDTAALTKEAGPVAPVLSLDGDFGEIAFSPDGRSIVVGRAKEAPMILDVEKGREILLGHDQSRPWSVSYSPDGRWCASSNLDQVMVWDARTGRLLRTFRGHTDHATGVTFAPDSRRLASASLDGTVRVWDVADLGGPTNQESRTLASRPSPILGVAHSRDGRFFATVEGFGHVHIGFSMSNRKPARAGSVTTWDAATGHEIGTLPMPEAPTATCHGVALDPDFRRIACAMSDGTVAIRDARMNRLIHTLRGHTDLVLRVAFSPDGRRLASASLDGSVRVWDAETGQLIRVLPGFRDAISRLRFSPDGRYLALAGEKNNQLHPAEVELWDAVTGRQLPPPGRLSHGHRRCHVPPPRGSGCLRGRVGHTYPGYA